MIKTWQSVLEDSNGHNFSTKAPKWVALFAFFSIWPLVSKSCIALPQGSLDTLLPSLWVGYLFESDSWSPSMFCICISFAFLFITNQKYKNMSSNLCLADETIIGQDNQSHALSNRWWSSLRFGPHNHHKEFIWAMMLFWSKIPSGRGLNFIRTFSRHLKT